MREQVLRVLPNTLEEVGRDRVWQTTHFMPDCRSSATPNCPSRSLSL